MDPWLHVLHNVAASIERFRAFGLSRILFPKGVPPSPMYRWDFPWNHPAIKEYHHLWKVPYFQEKMENQGAMNWETLNHMIGKNHHDLVEYGVKMGWFYMYLWLFSSSSFSYGKIHGERGHIGRKSSIDGHIPEHLRMMLGTRPVPYSGFKGYPNSYGKPAWFQPVSPLSRGRSPVYVQLWEWKYVDIAKAFLHWDNRDPTGWWKPWPSRKFVDLPSKMVDLSIVFFGMFTRG